MPPNALNGLHSTVITLQGSQDRQGQGPIQQLRGHTNPLGGGEGERVQDPAEEVRMGERRGKLKGHPPWGPYPFLLGNRTQTAHPPTSSLHAGGAKRDSGPRGQKLKLPKGLWHTGSKNMEENWAKDQGVSRAEETILE